MDRYDTLQVLTAPPPIALTIGSFDGVHLGHQALLRRLVQEGQTGRSVVLAFKNPPLSLLQPGIPFYLLSSLEERARLIGSLGPSLLYFLQFAEEMATWSARQFLEEVRRFIPFTSLILGYDAAFGKGKEGDRAFVEGLAREWGFCSLFLSPVTVDGIAVHSSAIRTAIGRGDLALAAKMLGRPYSLQTERYEISGGRLTASFKGICLPPGGTYPALLRYRNQALFARAALSSQNNELLVECPQPLDGITGSIAIEFVANS